MSKRQIEKINDKYLQRLRDEIENGDLEQAHSRGDDILVEILNELGLTDIVNAYTRIDKWFA